MRWRRRWSDFGIRHRKCNAPGAADEVRHIPVAPRGSRAAGGRGVGTRGRRGAVRVVEASIRAQIERRRAQRELIGRGLASLDQARRGGEFVPAAEVLKKLEGRLARARAKIAAKAKAGA
jgi:predicted transcriptional regulator